MTKGMFFSNPCSILFKSSKMTWLVDIEGRIGVGLSLFSIACPLSGASVSHCRQRTHSLPRLYLGPLSWAAHVQLQGLDLVSGVTVLMVVVLCWLHVSALEVLHNINM